GKLHRSEAVLRAGLGGEDDVELAARAFGARLDHRVIIALAAQQLGEQVGVRERATLDLRRIGRILAVGLERRLLAERLEQVFLLADRPQALDRPGVADVAGAVGRRLFALALCRLRRRVRRRVFR